jgi:hypothetical protein
VFPKQWAPEAGGQGPIISGTPQPKGMAWCKNQMKFMFLIFFYCDTQWVPPGITVIFFNKKVMFAF